ncbi:hypothetical protein B0T11DRAFT_287348 [Plectosphaerella cucumerina]|uniref:Uncharacterized protein n=1 Tax=Plectosphaerella cucumerina TaxID=40658 RepID=A0A8K0T805_9PEZI|nr:hypothetical protein B0T11DRAFT_287348 [Plectosphaerella cucumerina]
MDLRVEILPLRDVFVTKMLQEDPAPTSLDASSTILILVQVHFRPSWGEDQRRSSLSTISDSLIEDLEQQLGSSHADYMQVRVTYSHPAFPSRKPGHLSTPRVSRASDGVSSLHTSIETNATAAMERRDLSSQWSPRPTARTPNPLFRIVAAHWGPQRTANAIHEILDRGDSLHEGLDLAPPASTQSSRRVSASISYSSGNESTGTAWRTVADSEGPDDASNSGSVQLGGSAATTPVVVPQRKTSLQKNNTVRQPQPTLFPDRVPQKPRMSLDGFRNMPFTEIGHNARPRMAFSPRIADTSQPRVFGSANSPGYTAQSIAEDASKMKENRTPNSRGGSSAKNSPYSDSLHDFGLRSKIRKGSSTRKSSAASRTTGRWGWGGWW